jgi:hypothetical protein
MNDTPKSTAIVPRAALTVGAAIPMALSPTTIEGYQRLATAMAASSMLPQAYIARMEGRGQDRRLVPLPKEVVIGNLVTAMQFGAEVGLTPAQSVWSIAIINGLPYMWGEAPLGLVYASGQLEYIKESWEGEEAVGQKDQKGNYLQPLKLRAICEVKRRGQQPVKRSFSWAEAELAGLVEKGRTSYNPGMYMQYSRRMLQMRARGWALDDAFADVLKGIRSLADQEQLIKVISGELTVEDAPPRPKRSDFQQAQIAAPAEPAMDDLANQQLKRSENVPETVESQKNTKNGSEATQRTHENDREPASEEGEKRDMARQGAGVARGEPEPEEAAGAQAEAQRPTDEVPWTEVASVDGEPIPVGDMAAAKRVFLQELHKARTGKDVAALMQWNSHWLGKLTPVEEGAINEEIANVQDSISKRRG